MRRKSAAMTETQLAAHFLQGPDEVARRVHAMSAAGVGLLEILQNDHRAVMERLDALIAAGDRRSLRDARRLPRDERACSRPTRWLRSAFSMPGSRSERRRRR